MSSSHFPAGPKPPLPVEASLSRQLRPKAASTGRGGFIAPVHTLRHGRCRKPFTICSCKKCARNSSAFCTYKSLDLKSPGMNSYKKWGWGGPAGMLRQTVQTGLCHPEPLRLARDLSGLACLVPSARG